MALGDTAGLLFRIRSEGGKETAAELEAIKLASGGASSAFAAMGGPAGIAAVAIGAIATASIGAAVALFNLTKQASDYGSEIFDAAQKTGLTAEALGALKLAADTSGSSFENITGAVGKFNVLLGQAKQGNEKAEDVMKKYGITATNTTDALAQAVDVVNSLTSADQKAVAVKELFKDRTGALIPVIASMTAGLNAQIEAAKKLGVTLTESDIKAADEFGDTLKVLETQLSVVSARFALQFAPVITKAMSDVSVWFSSNQETVKAWGLAVAGVLARVARTVQQIAPTLKVLAGMLSQNWSLAAAGLQEITSMPSVFDPVDLNFGGGTPGAPAQASPDLQDIEAQKQAAEAARKAREEARKRELAALSDNARAQLDILRGQFDDAQKFVEGQFLDRAITEQQYRDTSELYFQKYSEKVKQYLAEALSFDSQGKQGAEITALQANYQKALEGLNREVTKERESVNKIIIESDKKANNELIKNAKLTADRQIELIEAAQKYTEAKYEAEIKNEIQLAQLKADLQNVSLNRKKDALNEELRAIKGNAEEEARILHEIELLDREIGTAKLEGQKKITKATEDTTKATNDLREAIEKAFEAEQEIVAKRQENERLRVLQQTVSSGQEIGAFAQLNDYFSGEGNTAAIAGINAMSQAFSGLGNALGQVVNAWVLYGKAGGSVRQVTAQILAGIAQQATVKAIFELAEGFAALALAFFGVPNAGPSATAHFTAAAIYGSIAVGAAVAGRVVAGNSFASQSAIGSGSSASGQGNAQHGAYSSRPDQVIEAGINSPSRWDEMTLNLRLNSNGVLDVFEDDVRRNGRSRSLILNVVKA